MFNAENLYDIIEKYKPIFNDIIKDMKLISLSIDDKASIFTFVNNRNDKVMISITNDLIEFTTENISISRKIKFRIPEKENPEFIVITETDIEKRFNSETNTFNSIVEKITKIYGYSTYSHEEMTLLDLDSKRYVFDSYIDCFKISDDAYLEAKAKMITSFECHMKTLIKLPDIMRWYLDTSTSSKTILNGKDISHIYATVDGINKVSRIYDLYRGIINKANADDIFAIRLGCLDENAFGYKIISGVSHEENLIAGTLVGNNPYDEDYDFIKDLFEEQIENQEISDYTNPLEIIGALKSMTSELYKPIVPIKKETFKDKVRKIMKKAN